MSRRAHNEALDRPRMPAGAHAPTAPAVEAGVRSEAATLDFPTLHDMQRRFGCQFANVRVHANPRAAAAAEAVDALAYTVGNHIVFGEGRFEPHTPRGRGLIAHELTHVLQQAAGNDGGRSETAMERQASHNARAVQGAGQLLTPAGGAPVSVMREAADGQNKPPPSLYARIKEKAYSGLIDLLRLAKTTYVQMLRGLATHLPASYQPAAETLIGIYETIIEILQSLILAILGIIVGFGEGIGGLVAGLFGLVRGTIKVTYDLFASLVTGSDAFERDLIAIGRALIGLPAAISALCREWLEQFEHSSPERQTLMIGELAGQIIALIATFEVSASKVGGAGRIGGAAETVEAAATTGARAAESTAATTRPALTVIEGGSGASRAPTAIARGGGPVTEGTSALKYAPQIEVPVTSPVKLVPPLPAQRVAAPAARLSAAKKLGIAAGIGTARASARLPDVLQDEVEDEKTGCRYRPVAQQSGRYPCHSAYATSLSHDRREFRVTTPEGRFMDFDAMDHGGTLYEVKTGYRFLVNPDPGLQERINRIRERFVDQSADQSQIAERCQRPLRWYFNEDVAARFFQVRQPLEPPVLHVPFDCDADSDERE